MKVIIGCNVPPRVSMFETRTGSGLYMHTMPPMSGDAEILQAALLARENRVPRRRPAVWPIVIVGLLVLVGIVLA